MKLLLIGNGPSALAKPLGEEIDTFDGKVVRFNDFRTKGYEDRLGSRTDIWVTTSAYGPHLRTAFEKVWVMTWATDRECKSHKSVQKYFPEAEKISADVINKTRALMDYNAPSSGSIAIQLFEGNEIYLYGFDFMMQKVHHYSDKLQPNDIHNAEKEWNYFNLLIQLGKVKQFGYDPKRETMPLVRWPTACGTDEDIRWYREPAHNTWYRWFGEMSKEKTILDVGAGVCSGMDVLGEQGAKEVVGFDVDERLRNDRLMIGDSLKPYPSKCVDVCTCVDVIEHCVYDLEVMNEMKRIAREAIYVTTPNFTRSRCGNPCHCREYTIAQFMNFFKPTEIWSASPDGKVHKTKLLKRFDDIILDYSPQGPMNKKDEPPELYKREVPIIKRFNETVDGMEWGHICGIFRL